MLHMLQWLYMHVASGCFKCFRRMLQVFHLDVAKVDMDVAYVSIATQVCCKCMLQMFQLFWTYVARSCKCFDIIHA
jgi:hypothetical protein